MLANCLQYLLALCLLVPDCFLLLPHCQAKNEMLPVPTLREESALKLSDFSKENIPNTW